MEQLITYFNHASNWEQIKILVSFFLVLWFIREIIGHFLKTGAILKELRTIRDLLFKEREE